MNIRELTAVSLLVFMHGCATQGEEPHKPVFSDKTITKITQKDKVLAKLLSGEWVDNPYFSPDDFSYLKLTSFYSSRAITDARFTERIHDPEHFEVHRTHFNFSGDLQYTKTVSLPEDEFWYRIDHLQRQMEKSSGQPILSVELPLKRSLQVLRGGNTR